MGLTTTILFTGTLVTNCDLCHDEATCLDSQERGDSFASQTLSCVCKDGFVGDGLTCYSSELCSNFSCCSHGYHWSPERGCVDTDECSLPDSPCAPLQVCQNIPGSFRCLEPSSSNKSGPSSQLIQQRPCESSRCPVGMYCINNHTSDWCVDPCDYYTVLQDNWRSTNNTIDQTHCDRGVTREGWYRMFLDQSSAHIPERCIEENRCGTHAPLWMAGPHPTRPGEIVNRTVCGSWSNNCCHFNLQSMQVKLCPGNYYVYKLVDPPTCLLSYCSGIVPFETSLHSKN